MIDSKAMNETLTTEELVRVFSVLAHDLKSPIFAIDGFSELLVSDYDSKLDEEGVDFLRRIRSGANQMKKVIDDMTHVVKLLTRPNESRPVALREMIEELRLRFNFLIEEGGVHFDLPNELPTVQGDPEKIREAFSALIANALTFNDRPKGERRVAIESERRGDRHRVCVLDNGIGFDPKYGQQIFDLGIKLDKSRGGGPGYGLYLAKRIVESHNGDISCDSTPGAGSRFCVDLPVTETA